MILPNLVSRKYKARETSKISIFVRVGGTKIAVNCPKSSSTYKIGSQFSSKNKSEEEDNIAISIF